MPVKHAKTLALPEGPDPLLLQPSDWNAALLAPPFVVPLIGTSITFTNLSATPGELPGNYRTRVDLANVGQVRLVVCVGVAGAAAMVMKAQYSTDQSNWSDLTANTAALNVLNVRESAWSDIPVGARGDVYVRLWSLGDGTADPQIRLVQLQVR